MEPQQKIIKKEFLTKVVLSHTAGLQRFAFSLCKNKFDADDLVSETMLKAFENYQRLKDESKIKQWLFRILNNQFISNYRSQKKFTELVVSEDTYPKDDFSFSLFEEVANSSFVEEGNPEKKFISKLTQSDIQQAINNLPDEFRVSLTLCDMEDFSYAEIASITKAPIGTVRSRIARARSILQKTLWLHALELGIKKSKTVLVKKEYTCTCGEEEVQQTISISE
ncbi:MAG: RNA polymerase sigma factor [Saprospiraceae bacterium]